MTATTETPSTDGRTDMSGAIRGETSQIRVLCVRRDDIKCVYASRTKRAVMAMAEMRVVYSIPNNFLTLPASNFGARFLFPGRFGIFGSGPKCI